MDRLGTTAARAAALVVGCVPAPSRAFELGVGGGYTQGFGQVAPDHRAADVAGPGGGVDLTADYRASARVSVGVQGELQEFDSRRNVAARGMAGSLGATLHASPSGRGDPWVRLGVGYRLLWSIHPPGEPTTLVHGFEVAKATVGWDLRVSPDIALSPVLGADLDLFAWRVQSGLDAPLAAPQLGAFVFAGVQGRLDF